MIENVIFDIGGVLVDYHTDTYYENRGYSKEESRKLADATMRSTWWCEYDRGIFTEKEIRGFFEKDAPDLAGDIEKSLSDLKDIVTKRDSTIPWIQHVHARGRKAYFLSNFSLPALRDCEDAMAFRKVMDGGILSFEEGIIKPDAEIYKLILSRYQLNPEKSVFIDDTRRNLPMAEHFGIRTIHFQTLQQAQSDLDRMLDEK